MGWPGVPDHVSLWGLLRTRKANTPASALGARMFERTDRESVSQQSVLTRQGTDRILRYAFDWRWRGCERR